MRPAHVDARRKDANGDFPFIVGESRLPEGDYLVKEDDSDPSVIAIASADGHQRIYSLAMMSSSSEKRVAQPRLVFEKFDGQYFLARVVREDGEAQEIVLTPAIMEHEVDTAR